MENRSSADVSAAILRSLSARRFLAMGAGAVAYVRETDVGDGQKAYVIHGADGTALNAQADYASAIWAIRENNLEPVALH